MDSPAPAPAVLGVVGWKNSGKTTLTAALVRSLVARGHRVSTIKHAHVHFDIDHPGRDSFRHREAGAQEVAIASPRRWAVMHELRGGPEPTLAEMLARLSPCDVVLVEGYKHGPHPKLEVRRHGARQRDPLAPTDPHICAVVSDTPRAEPDAIPVFGLEDIDAITDHVIATLAPRATGAPPR